MSAEDRLGIHELYARYNWATDTGDVDAWLNSFTQDATYELPTGARLAGQEELRRWIQERFAFRETESTIGEHWVTNFVFDGTPPVVAVRCYFARVVFPREGNGPIEIGNAGFYRDEVVKVKGRWVFSRRKAFVRQLPWRGVDPRRASTP